MLKCACFSLLFLLFAGVLFLMVMYDLFWESLEEFFFNPPRFTGYATVTLLISNSSFGFVFTDRDEKRELFYRTKKFIHLFSLLKQRSFILEYAFTAEICLERRADLYLKYFTILCFYVRDKRRFEK